MKTALFALAVAAGLALVNSADAQQTRLGGMEGFVQSPRYAPGEAEKGWKFDDDNKDSGAAAAERLQKYLPADEEPIAPGRAPEGSGAGTLKSGTAVLRNP